MSYKFGRTSMKRLNTCHPYLQAILELAIQRSPVDFGVSEGYRSLARQKELFLQGKSKIDGVRRKGKHNHKPSLAVDVYAYCANNDVRRKIAYDRVHLAAIAGVIVSCARELKEKGIIDCDIRWGADWNSNGVIDYDQSFDDYPHFELVNIK